LPDVGVRTQRGSAAEPREFFPVEQETAAGAVDDARPDRWGERVIRFLDKPSRLAVLDFLFYAGDERSGAWCSTS